MPDWLTRLLPEGWGATEFLVASIALTATTMVVSLISVALIVVRIPTDYFAGDTPPRLWADRHPLVRWPLLIFKNLLGVTLVALGAVMALPGVPGQGILTMLIGAMLINFPGKRKMERWLIGRRGVLTAINKIRGRYGRPPLQLDSLVAAP